MVLSRPDILKRIEAGNLKFTPSVPTSAIKQCSIDLRLGRIFSVFKKTANPGIGALSIQNAKAIFDAQDLWEQKEADHWTLYPGDFVLTQTLESVHLPNDLMGLVEGRSSWARLGISVHVTAPKIDPGFDAPITLELANHSNMAVIFEAGVEQPCQLILVKLSKPLKPEEMYGSLPGDFFANQSKPIPTKKNVKK